MPARSKTAALLALVPALALATSSDAAPTAQRPRPRRPVKKPPEPPVPAPTPVEPPADAPVEPAPAAAPAPAPGGSGAASPDPAKPPELDGDKPADKPRPGDAPDVDNLRQEYLSLRDELFKSRARANAVASQLYSTRVQIKLTYTTGRFYNPAKSSIRLDGASVYEDASGAIAGDDGVRFDGYIAPGRHLITFHVDAVGKDDDSFTSSTESQIVVKAVAGKDLIVAAKAKDTGDIAYEWKRSEKGSYGLGIDVAVRAAAPPEAGAKK